MPVTVKATITQFIQLDKIDNRELQGKNLFHLGKVSIVSLSSQHHSIFKISLKYGK